MPGCGFVLGNQTADGGFAKVQFVTELGDAALLLHVFAALSEFERSLIREHTQAGLVASHRDVNGSLALKLEVTCLPEPLCFKVTGY